MSSELVPRNTHATPAVADHDNRYKAVQAKLASLAKAMDDATLELEDLHKGMRDNAAHTDGVATDIANADLEAKFVDVTTHVATALTGAARQVRTLKDTAQETADLAHKTRRSHFRFYSGLDDVRSKRKEKTPRAGFFNR